MEATAYANQEKHELCADLSWSVIKSVNFQWEPLLMIKGTNQIERLVSPFLKIRGLGVNLVQVETEVEKAVYDLTRNKGDI